MKLDEAIEKLIHISRNKAFNRRFDEEEAAKLGIEALKDKLEARRYGVPCSAILLPGETEE